MYKDANETGAVAPFVAIMLVLLVGCLALVVDLGRLHNVKIELQRAVDAAALAGALKLDGTDEEAQAAQESAVATAGGNIVNGSPLVLVATDISLGTWQAAAYEETIDDRFEPSATIPDPSAGYNAVKVSKSVVVNDLIFSRIWSIDSATVAADAIAVTAFEQPGLPIALLSCNHSNSGLADSVCEIKMYKWSMDPEDTAGWTGLTFNTSAQTLKDFFSGKLDINRVLYGDNDDHQGLENTAVLKQTDSSGPCGNEAINKNTGNNFEYEIVCGLGEDFDESILPPGNDPLQYNPLPRWYNDIAFERILSMDGMLGEEGSDDYQTRLGLLFSAAERFSYGDPGAYNDYINYCQLNGIDYNSAILDDRFMRYIEWDKKEKKYVVHPEEALRDAGYPLVQAKNGQDTAVLAAFIDRVSAEANDGHFKDSLTASAGPFAEEGADATGETLPVTIPVIYAGECGGWKALKGKFYIGTANLLVTRIWKNNHDCWDVKYVDETHHPLVSADSCTDNFTPIVPSRTFRCVTKKDSGAEAGIEALIWKKGKKAMSGVLRVELVE